MATEEDVRREEARRAEAQVAQGAHSTRPSAEGTNDWLDDITETLTASSKRLNEIMQAHPETKDAYLPVLRQLAELSFRMITMRYDVESGQPPRGPVDNASEQGEDGAMEARIAALEKDVATIKTDVAVIRSNYATKEDLHKELHGATWKILGSIAVLCGAVFWMARNITPSQMPAPSSPPAQTATQNSTPTTTPQPTAPLQSSH